jgi:hypothetical protein
VGRLTAIKAIQGALREIAPMTSTGAFGVAGMHDATAQRAQDIGAQINYRDQDVKGRGQDIAAQSQAIGHAVTARGQDIDAATKARALDINKIGVEASANLHNANAKVLDEQGKPNALAVDAVKKRADAWNKYQNSDAVSQDISSKTDPKEIAATIARHRAIFDQMNPRKPISAIENKDGTATIVFDDGSHVTGSKKTN